MDPVSADLLRLVFVKLQLIIKREDAETKQTNLTWSLHHRHLHAALCAAAEQPVINVACKLTVAVHFPHSTSYGAGWDVCSCLLAR